MDQNLDRSFIENNLQQWKAALDRCGLLVLDRFFTKDHLESIHRESRRLLARAKRKDLSIFSTLLSERRMSTLGGKALKSASPLLRDLYHSEALLETLEGITGEKLFRVQDENEDIVLNVLHHRRDVHGRHVDTYPYAFNIMVQAPPPGTGGELILYSERDEELVRTHIRKGQCYLIRTDRYEHEVTPLLGEGERIVLNMSFANASTKDLFSYSSSLLYD